MLEVFGDLLLIIIVNTRHCFYLRTVGHLNRQGWPMNLTKQVAPHRQARRSFISRCADVSFIDVLEKRHYQSSNCRAENYYIIGNGYAAGQRPCD
ncbi:hypothetical protein ACULMA_00670 [Xanthomonas arboricola pv. corylina]|uniref:hypothetical protein n=1 Tax=Xanthomonas arboricola TaxID=56448 RepID=UPI0040409FE4